VLSILYDGLTEADARHKEIECIASANSVLKGYNMTPGGDGVPIGWPGANKGKRFSQEWCDRISQALTGHVLSSETKSKIGAASKGHAVSQGTRDRVSLALTGRVRPPEVGEKIRAANLGKMRTPVVERECPMCGSKFQTRVNTMGRKYCSKSCACKFAGQRNSRVTC